MPRKDSGSRQYMLSEDYEIYEKHGMTNDKIMLHYHNFYEVIHILDGTFITHIDGYEYCLKSGDFLLVDSSKLHRPSFDDPATHTNHRIVLWVTKELLSSISDDKTDLKECFSRGPAFHLPVYEGRALSKLLMNILVKEEDDAYGNSLLMRSYFTEFFVLFNRLCLDNRYTKPQNNYSYTLFDKITAYIDEHISEPISIDDMSSYVYMSKYYFLRKFKEETTLTAHDFLIHKRLIRACELIDDGTPVSKVYEHCGFSDYSSFFRNFKSVYGISPSDYARNGRESHFLDH